MALASPRLQSLVAFLVVFRERPIARQRLAFVLWPDSSEPQARTNLRKALHQVRQALGWHADRHLRMDERGVQWLEEAGDGDVDLIRFERAATRGLEHGDESELAIAAAAWGGDLLSGRDDEWLDPERRRLRQRAASVFATMAAAAHERGEGWRAVELTERLLRLDPFDESAHRRVIQLHADAGDDLRAVRAYHEWFAMLDRELGVAPELATVALYDSLFGRRATSHVRGSSHGRRPERMPLKGRATELERLAGAWRRAADGAPQLVLVTGEPGIGKSRIVDELRQRCAGAGADVAAVGARAYKAPGAMPYAPVAELLRSDAFRAMTLPPGSVAAHALAELMSGGTVGSRAAGDSGPADPLNREQLFEAVAAVMTAVPQPLLVTLDDLHWCDADTLAMLRFVVHRAARRGSPLFIAATARSAELASRPELLTFMNDLSSHGLAEELALERLSDADAGALVRHVLGPEEAPGTVDHVVAAAEGNPLFLREMLRADGQPAPGDPLPPRVHAVIETRLSELSETARDAATIGAVVGRSFRTDVITNVLSDGADVVGALDELWRRGIVRECGVDGYDFTHDKLREVAYDRLGPSRRRALHRAVADAMAASQVEGDPAQLAHHLELGGRTDAAIRAYRDAVARASHVYAHDDVITACRSRAGAGRRSPSRSGPRRGRTRVPHPARRLVVRRSRRRATGGDCVRAGPRAAQSPRPVARSVDAADLGQRGDRTPPLRRGARLRRDAHGGWP